ncbi:class I SAM-dependent methyltransferase [Glaciecola sp. HTCC2999]|uniref:class I SAM-dependent methyltransferase n=1 Tax=Glaciecola sp. HTCC2999 TaxID=455436 RepID=UPI0000E0E871|nr:methyltransferase domain-containing protein [Glaciecola sp. HTCC2999]
MFIGQAFRHTPLAYPEDWHVCPQHEVITAQINTLIKQHCDTIYGDVQVNIGELSVLDASEDNRLRKTINLHVNHDHIDTLANTVCPIHTERHQTVYGKLIELPFGQGTVDTACLINALDFTHDPHQLLREVERVTRSDGHIILTGCNPLSLSGLLHQLPVYQAHPFSSARFFSYYRVKEWLNVLGFSIKYRCFFGPANIFGKPKKIKETIDTIGSSSMRSMYFIVAQKHEIPMSVIKPKFAKVTPRLQSAQPSLRVK